METFAEIVPQIVLCLFTPLLGACVLAWVLLQLPSPGSRKRAKLGKSVCAGLVVLAIACTTLIGKNTNGVNGVGGMFLMQFNPPAVLSVTPEDISNGWRVAEVSDAGAFAPPPANAVTNELWRLRGAHDDAFRIPADGWSYPFASGVTVLSRGAIRRDIRSRDFPRAFEQDLSLLPVVNWQFLPDGRNESVFWHGSTPSNTLIATWWNAALGRDATNPVCFQAELYTNGGFDYRYEDRTVRHVHVWPFDLDDDGLENSVDPDPLVAGADAHGTNAEWYNVVCSNVLEAVEGDGSAGTPRPTLSWLDGVNTNAYYFVDVVMTNGLAPIYFTGDRESRLGNPVVVARGFETNHVPLLIGINYAVTSPVPFTVSIPDDGFTSVTTNAVSNYEVQWPLNFVFNESVGESNRVYSVTVEPYDPGGELTWSNAGGGMRSGTPSECDCGCLHCSGYSVWFSCSAICRCSGECQAVGNYTVEDALFAVTGGVCRCGFDDPGEVETTNSTPFSVSFSKQAVIFEDAYEDSPGVMKPKRSSRVRITVDAYGGEYGGVLSLTSANLDKLTPVGNGVTLYPSRTLAAAEYFHTTGVYEGATQSTEENDVSVSGTFTEHFTAQQHLSSNCLTVVRVELRPNVSAPNNCNLNRHTYGVYELVRHIQEPLTPVVTWNPVGGGANEVVGTTDYYRCPLYGCKNPLRAEIGATTYPFDVDVLEPNGMESKATGVVVYSNAVHKGEAGGIGMELYLYVKPFNVSFSEIAVEEVPCFTYEARGYFSNPYFNGVFAHTGGSWGAGAGTWMDVNAGDNRLLGYDTAAYNAKIPWLTPSGTPTTNAAYAWTYGFALTDNPFGWNVKGTTGDTPPYKQFGEDIQDEFMIDNRGSVGVAKLYNRVLRTTNDVITLDGPRTNKGYE